MFKNNNRSVQLLVGRSFFSFPFVRVANANLSTRACTLTVSVHNNARGARCFFAPIAARGRHCSGARENRGWHRYCRAAVAVVMGKLICVDFCGVRASVCSLSSVWEMCDAKGKRRLVLFRTHRQRTHTHTTCRRRRRRHHHLFSVSRYAADLKNYECLVVVWLSAFGKRVYK